MPIRNRRKRDEAEAATIPQTTTATVGAATTAAGLTATQADLCPKPDRGDGLG